MIRTMRRSLLILAVVLAVLVAAAAAFAVARSGPIGTIFGARMIRAEVVERDGSVYDLYRGQLVAVSPASVTVQEADGHVDTIPISVTTRVTMNGRPATRLALRRATQATVVRPSGGTAILVQARR
jgi:hypothetical protein